MIWNRFEADRTALGTQYTEEHWDEGSGLSPEALRTELLDIERAMAGQPAIAVKTRLYEKVLACARLDVDRRDFFPEKLNHDFLLSRIRGRWIKDFRARDMADLLAETDAAVRGLCYTGDADFGHTAPDWEAVMTLGIPGLRARVLAAREVQRRRWEPLGWSLNSQVPGPQLRRRGGPVAHGRDRAAADHQPDGSPARLSPAPGSPRAADQGELVSPPAR